MRSISEASILIVDDEVGVTRLTERLLTRAGYLVIAVNSPKKGIEVLENKHVDLLLVDIRMPEMDGFQLMEIARSYHPDIAVVIMTGYGTVETAVESLRKGADGMVLKPFAGVELVQNVERALREKRNQKEIQQLRVLRPLFDITEALFSEKKPEQLKTLILNIACDHLDSVYAGLVNLEAEAYRMVAEKGEPLSSDFMEIFKQAVENRTPLILDSGGLDGSKRENLLLKNNLFSIICVPNTTNDDFHIFVVGRGPTGPPFGVSDSEMAALFTRQAAIALENARLYSEVQESLQKVQKSQQALVQAEKMAVVGRLTASIAHEINNPLQTVRNCLHLIEHGNLSGKALNEYIVLVTEELDRLMNAAKRMLDFYRPSALDRQPEDINLIVGQVSSLLESQYQRYNVHVDFDLVENLPRVMVVSNQIQQALFNIMLNAIEAMPEGGEIFVSTGIIDKQVIISIEDTGSGIPESEKENIFEPFVTSKEDGLGLGLTVSYGIVTAHGGTLELLPAPGRGARFLITLPAGG